MPALSSAFNGMNSMTGFHPMGQHHISSTGSAAAMTPVTPSAIMSMSGGQHIAASVAPSGTGPCGMQQQQQPQPQQQQQQQQQHAIHSSGGYGCMNSSGRTPPSVSGSGGTSYVDLSAISPYNRHHHHPHHHSAHHHHHHAGSMTGSIGLGHNPMGPSATSVAMAATASHTYHQSVNGQYGMHHNSHSSTGKAFKS